MLKHFFDWAHVVFNCAICFFVLVASRAPSSWLTLMYPSSIFAFNLAHVLSPSFIIQLSFPSSAMAFNLPFQLIPLTFRSFISLLCHHYQQAVWPSLYWPLKGQTSHTSIKAHSSLRLSIKYLKWLWMIYYEKSTNAVVTVCLCNLHSKDQ